MTRRQIVRPYDDRPRIPAEQLWFDKETDTLEVSAPTGIVLTVPAWLVRQLIDELVDKGDEISL